MNFNVITYMWYMIVSITFTIWVARTLYKNGRVFLINVFRDNYSLADSINHLLIVGFYLVNLGFILLTLKEGLVIVGLQDLVETLASKIGIVLLVLGGMHFGNIILLAKFGSPVKQIGQHEHQNLLGRDSQVSEKQLWSAAALTDGSSI